MNKEDMIKKIIMVILDQLNVNLTIEQVTEGSRLEDIGINSLNFIQVIVALEDEFDVEFDDEELEISKFLTIQDIYEELVTLMQ